MPRKTTTKVRAEHKPERRRRHGIEVKAAARKLFVEEGLSYLDVGARLKVPESIVRKWSKTGNWERSREELSGSARTLYEMALKILKAKLMQLEQLPPEQITTGQLDGLNKLMLTVQNARETVRLLEAAVIAGEEFIGFIRRTVPDEATRTIIFHEWERFLDWAKEAS